MTRARRLVARYARSIRMDKSGLREFSKHLEKEFLHVVEHASGPLGNRVIGQWPFEIRAVDGVPLTVYVRLEAQQTRDFRYVMSGGLGFLRGHPVAVAHVNGSLDPEVLAKGAESHLFMSQLYPILLHELTHAADRYTKGVNDRGDMSEDDAHNNLARYYNDPSEVRAYMQQVVDEVSTHFKHWPKLQRMMGPKALPTLLNFSETWKDASPHWTDRNQRAVIKAVAQELNDWEAAQHV